MMRAVYFVWVLTLLAASAPAGATEPEPAFRLDKTLADCGAVGDDTASYRRCIGKAADKFLARMKHDVLCPGDTCLIRLKCNEDGSLCEGGGYSVFYGNTETGHTIKIRLASGKITNYFRCGSCSAIEPDDDNPIPLRMLETAKGLILEIPASEHNM